MNLRVAHLSNEYQRWHVPAGARTGSFFLRLMLVHPAIQKADPTRQLKELKCES